jgi:hypothetical protein
MNDDNWQVLCTRRYRWIKGKHTRNSRQKEQPAYRTVYLPTVPVGFRISACKAAAEASTRSLLISRTACST